MKACMVAYTFYEADNRVRRYAETLVKRGDEVDAIVLRREGQSPFEVIAGVNVYRIQKRIRDEGGPSSYLRKLLIFLLRSAWVLTRRHLRARYDIIHVHSVPDFQVFATLVPRLMGARVILDIHDIVPELYATKFNVSERSLPFRLLVLMERLSVRYSDHAIISNHLWHERLVRRSAQPERCTTILNYPDLSIFYRRPRTVANGGEFIMCYPGTLSWHQGVDIVIGAMAQLRDEANNLRFLILGDGAERERLIALAKEHGLEDRVTIIKGVPIEEVAKTMANVDLGLEPKRKHSCANEALSTKILEFMAMGVPVLASDTRVHQMYFTDDMVEFFESENVADLAAKILALIRNPARRTAMRERGVEFILENNWDLKKNEYLDLVDRLVKRSALIATEGERPTPQPNRS
jgi:glycosyltransferase involved in cell wall biosynthesis